MATSVPVTQVFVDELPEGASFNLANRVEVTRTTRNVLPPATTPARPGYGSQPRLPLEEAPYRSAPVIPYQSAPIAPATISSMPYPHKGVAHVRPGNDTASSWRTILIVLVVYAALTFLPVMGSIFLLTEQNYKFWIGWFYPTILLLSIIAIAIVLVATVVSLQRITPRYLHTQSFVATLACIFTALLGIILILVSLPMSRELYDVAGRIGHGCMNSLEKSNLLMDYDTVLYTIKSQPQCAQHESVELCPGWSANPYTLYIQYLEYEFQCGPVCAEMVMPRANVVSVSLLNNGTLLTKGRAGATKRGAAQLQTSGLPASVQVREQKLFTQGETRSSCLTLVATRLQVLAWCFCDLMFWEGVGLLLVSLTVAVSVFFDQFLSAGKSGK